MISVRIQMLKKKKKKGENLLKVMFGLQIKLNDKLQSSISQDPFLHQLLCEATVCM